MSHTQKATCAIKVTETTRELFKLMNFHEIPEEATYIAFLEDGDATFLTGEIKRIGICGLPKMAFITYETDLVVEF